MTALTLKATIEVGAGSIATHCHGLQALIHINTLLASGVKSEPLWTGAPEGSVSIDTGASLADIFYHITFIEVFRSTCRPSSARTQWTQFAELWTVDLRTLITPAIVAVIL